MLIFSKLPYAMIKNGKQSYVSQLKSIIDFCILLKFGMSTHVFKISLCYNKKWEIKLCISVNIYHRLPKLGMSTHVFKISLCYDKKWEIKLCISVNIYRRLLKMGNKVMYLS